MPAYLSTFDKYNMETNWNNSAGYLVCRLAGEKPTNQWSSLQATCVPRSGQNVEQCAGYVRAVGGHSASIFEKHEDSE